MLETKENQEIFKKQFNISDERFRNSRMTWGELNEIEKDFDSKRDEHECTVKKYAEEIQQCPYVHSLSFRVKETSHLLEKIIRKNEEYLEKGCSISINNYETRITDLMGIRVLLLFKEDWIYVHEYLLDRYAAMLMEEPFVHIRKGDDDALYKGRIKIKDTKPYRSAHYLLRTEKGLGIEIQVRTLYEEAWSEIDHKLRYPYNLSNNVLANYIGIMNRITGIGDEMGSFVNSYIRNFNDKLFQGVTNDNEVYQYILDELQKMEDCEIKENIIDKIKQAEKYREMINVSEVLSAALEFEGQE